MKRWTNRRVKRFEWLRRIQAFAAVYNGVNETLMPKKYKKWALKKGYIRENKTNADGFILYEITALGNAVLTIFIYRELR